MKIRVHIVVNNLCSKFDVLLHQCRQAVLASAHTEQEAVKGFKVGSLAVEQCVHIHSAKVRNKRMNRIYQILVARSAVMLS